MSAIKDRLVQKIEPFVNITEDLEIFLEGIVSELENVWAEVNARRYGMDNKLTFESGVLISQSPNGGTTLTLSGAPTTDLTNTFVAGDQIVLIRNDLDADGIYTIQSVTSNTLVLTTPYPKYATDIKFANYRASLFNMLRNLDIFPSGLENGAQLQALLAQSKDILKKRGSYLGASEEIGRLTNSSVTTLSAMRTLVEL